MRTSVALAGTFLAAAAFVGLSSTAANAEAPSQQGWWTSTNPGSVHGSPSSPAPPDVPPNGLLIEGSASSSSGSSDSAPTAFGALVYEIPTGATVRELTLSVAPNSATTPGSTLELCLLDNAAINPEQGGPMSDSPSSSCGEDVTAQPSSSGATYQFNVSSLLVNGTVAVAILPTSATDRVVLAQPDAASLPVQIQNTNLGGGTSASTVPSSTFPGVGHPPSGTGVQSNPSDIPATAPVPASSGSDSTLPSSAVSESQASAAPSPSIAAPPNSQTSSSQTIQAAGTAPSSTQFTSTSSGIDPAKPLAVALLLVALLAGGVTWTGAGRAAARAAVRGNPSAGS